jgi:hypothetical protein
MIVARRLSRFGWVASGIVVLLLVVARLVKTQGSVASRPGALTAEAMRRFASVPAFRLPLSQQRSDFLVGSFLPSFAGDCSAKHAPALCRGGEEDVAGM